MQCANGEEKNPAMAAKRITTEDRGSELANGLHAMNSSKKILCIEDELETAALIAEELSERGFAVVPAYDGHEGFAAILRESPDLVLCDICMPRLSGFELLTSLTAVAPRFERMPFVFLTALAGQDFEVKGRRLGADDYVIKPIDFDILEAVIDARMAGVARNAVWPKLMHLSEREAETLTWAARGKTSAEIAVILGLTKRTVDFYIDSARDKLGVTRRIQAAVTATSGGLIEP
jgi:DNA-binding NarL/FixJ family response regulator